MKTKMYYIADDGTEYATSAAAKSHNNLIKEIAVAMAPLGPKVKDRSCEFANGGGYRQHKLAHVLTAKRALIKIARREVPSQIWDHPAEEIHPLSFAGRLLDESNTALSNAWRRFACIDTNGREWGQPYYALNPHKGKQAEWSLTR